MMNKKSVKNRETLTNKDSAKFLGGNLSFAAAESYKLLRTNLNFSIPNGKACKVIGITSALKGEGKSTTAVNIAYTMAQAGGKVLLIEGDLRLPTMSKRLGVNPEPGVSNLLVGQCGIKDAIQNSGMKANLWVMTAGELPPNPAELLGSENMEKLIKVLSESFDTIILDLPPLSVVSDALIASGYINGMIVVVRQGYCDRRAVDDAVRQLQFADVKILGFVMNGATTQAKSYKRYGKSYGYYNQNQRYGDTPGKQR